MRTALSGCPQRMGSGQARSYNRASNNCLKASWTMSKLTLIAALLSLLPSSVAATATAEQPARAPTAAELQVLIQDSWPSFSHLIRQQERLMEAPTRLTSLPQALCRCEMAETYECACLVEYQLTNGRLRSALLRHHVGRDAQGRLLAVIFIRETPTPQSGAGVR